MIGFGEAGSAFAGAISVPLSAYDCKTDRDETIAAMQLAFDKTGVCGCTSAAEALSGAGAVLSLVTAADALEAAIADAPMLEPGTLWIDMNSVAPQTKLRAAEAIERAGGSYVDVAIMAPVHPALLAVPMLISGAEAERAAEVLEGLGFTDLRVVGSEIGRASGVKMLRSIMVKGIEALTAEMMLAARQAGVTDEVLASLGDDWSSKASYNLERMRTHGGRRAAEMEEVARTLEMLGVEPLMTRGTIQRQREMAQ